MNIIINLKVIIGVIIIVGATNSLPPDCEGQGSVFIVEPTDVEIQCKTSTIVEFPCQYKAQSKGHPLWMINSAVFTLSKLPKDHSFDGKTLSVQNIKLEQNNTRYQCLLEVTKSGRHACIHRSTIGHLIIRCGAPSIQCIPHYDYETANLKAISIKIPQVEFNTSHTITYYDSPSGKKCGSASIPPSSCISGVCNDLLEVPSHCLTSDIVYLAVSVNEYDAKSPPKPINIDSTNKFIEISFNEMPSIHCTFINQPKENKKNYTIKYALAVAGHGCIDLPIRMKGEVSHSNAVVLPLEINLSESTEICFDVIASNGTKTVTVKGIYKLVQGSGVAVPRDTIHSIVLIIIVCGLIVVISMLSLCTIMRMLKKTPYDKQGGSDGELNEEYDSNRISSKQKWLKDIDPSTTYSKLHTIKEKCFFHEYAAKHHPGYQPHTGYGYYQGEIKSIINKHYKKLILMSEDGKTPRFAIFSSAIKQCDEDGWSDVYVRGTSWKRELSPGTKFLYCVRSKIITHRAYWIEYHVTEECRDELQLVIDKIGGFQTEWSRSQYGYFEFKEPEYIKPHQQVIVKKKNGDLATGPGIRHLIRATGDGSNKIKPPDLSKHEKWERVFIQSREINRKLIPGTKYLFCAMMKKIPLTVHREVYTITKKCKMAEFGRRHIPGFKFEFGRGFFEFKQKELLKPHKAVILVDKENQLFTGAGAQFFYTKDYTFDQIQTEAVLPPNLDKTRWKHIFIQSRSEERELLPGTKFLYCEYQFHTNIFS